jgi:hypothetical protein
MHFWPLNPVMIDNNGEFYRYRKVRRIIIFDVAVFIVLVLACAEVSARPPVDISAVPGYEGFYKKGSGLPVKIVLKNRDGRAVAGSLRISGGITELYKPVTLKPYSGTTDWVFLYPKPGSIVSLQFITEENMAIRKEVALSPLIGIQHIAVHISREKGTLEHTGLGALLKTRIIDVTPEDLWSNWKGYEQSDFVIFDAGTVELISARQLKALQRYVLSGGVLYVYGRPYPEMYKHEFFKNILPVTIDGINVIVPDALYPGSPNIQVLSSNQDGQRAVSHSVNGYTLWTERKRGLGRVVLLTFDLADNAFQPLMTDFNNFWSRGRKHQISFILPEADLREDIDTLVLNLVTVNGLYLFLLVPIGFMGRAGYRKIFWALLSVCITISMLSSSGVLNGKNRLYGLNVVNIFPEEKEAFVSSELQAVSTKKGEMRVHFLYDDSSPFPAVRSSRIPGLTISDKGIEADMNMLGHGSFTWEGFTVPDPVLAVDLRMSGQRLKGRIQNISGHMLGNPYIVVNGRFYPLSSLEEGDVIPVDLHLQNDNSYPGPEGQSWIKSLVQDTGEAAGFRSVKIVAILEKPVLNFIRNNSFTHREKTLLVYHM